MKNILVIKSDKKNWEKTTFPKWKLIEQCDSMAKAKEVLIRSSLDCIGGDWMERNGRMWNPFSKSYLCTNQDLSFNYAGRIFMIINENDVSKFQGEELGYLPNNILNLFKK